VKSDEKVSNFVSFLEKNHENQGKLPYVVSWQGILKNCEGTKIKGKTYY